MVVFRLSKLRDAGAALAAFGERRFGIFQAGLEIKMVPRAGIEPALLSEPDFESGASTNSANGATGGNDRGLYHGLTRNDKPLPAVTDEEVIALIDRMSSSYATIKKGSEIVQTVIKPPGLFRCPARPLPGGSRCPSAYRLGHLPVPDGLEGIASCHRSYSGFSKVGRSAGSWTALGPSPSMAFPSKNTRSLSLRIFAGVTTPGEWPHPLDVKQEVLGEFKLHPGKEVFQAGTSEIIVP